jgi:DNA (cytosine-5)-methyltransferase 1
MAVEEAFDGTTAWVSDVDPGANTILSHHWPTTPNIGDLTTTRWEDIEPVDIVCGGYPCQPFSTAGKRKGTSDVRHLWPFIAGALRVLRPRVAIFENVANHLRLGFNTVLCDLADLGFDVEWRVVQADEVGAPHQRRRLIFIATASDAADLGHQWARSARERRTGPADSRLAAADAPSLGRGEGWPESTGQQGRPGAAGRGLQDWGRFAPAIARWEEATGRPAPWATDDRSRLNPAFVEWMMGLPAGHVTAVPGLTRTQQLKALGNGVVPQQAAAALRLLLERSTAHQLAA